MDVENSSLWYIYGLLPENLIKIINHYTVQVSLLQLCSYIWAINICRFDKLYIIFSTKLTHGKKSSRFSPQNRDEMKKMYSPEIKCETVNEICYKRYA